MAEVDQELAEFAALRDQRGGNPDTARPFNDVRQMIRLFLLRNVPKSNEVLVGWWADRPQVRSPADDVTQDAEFREAVRGLLDTGGHAEVSTAGHGELLVTVQPVRTASGADTGALVVVTYLDRARDELIDTMRTYTIASLLALLAITALAAWQSGRLLAPLRTLQETAEEITETDLARRLPETGNDDITALTRTVNGMLDRLESAFVGAAPVPRRRRPRAQDTPHRPARPPRAARPRDPERASPRRASCSSTRPTGCHAWSAT